MTLKSPKCIGELLPTNAHLDYCQEPSFKLRAVLFSIPTAPTNLPFAENELAISRGDKRRQQETKRTKASLSGGTFGFAKEQSYSKLQAALGCELFWSAASKSLRKATFRLWHGCLVVSEPWRSLMQAAATGCLYKPAPGL
jgi:hypothetical protein